MSTSEITIGLICLAVGTLIGVIISRTTSPVEKKQRQTEQRLKETEQELKDYQNDVTEHFIKTADLVNNLTQSYRDVHEHMATSAIHLTNPEISRQLLNSGADPLIDPSILDSRTLPGNSPEPPKDYAPKSSEGILSESYGLTEETKATPPPHHGADTGKETSETDDPTLKTG